MSEMRRCHDEGIKMLETPSLPVKEISQLRAISCIFGILAYLQDEPLCGKCSSFTNVFEKSMEKFMVIEKALGRNRNIPEETRDFFQVSMGCCHV
jgi:hypothetical protein